MATKRKGYGTVVAYSPTDSVYTSITDAAKVKFPKIEIEDSESTHLLSADQAREFLPDGGWLTSDDLSIDAWFTNAQYVTLHALFIARTTDYWRLTLALVSGESQGPVAKLQGYIKSVEIQEIDSKSSDPVRAVFMIKRYTAAPTFITSS